MPPAIRPAQRRSARRTSGPSYELEYETYRQQNLAEDGALFFDSRDALVPNASDGRQNVYEYEDGHIHAISDVAGGYESFFMDASPDGSNVFFATADQLLPEDKSNNVEVWDARVGGGYPVTSTPPPCDNGDACKPPPYAAAGGPRRAGERDLLRPGGSHTDALVGGRKAEPHHEIGEMRQGQAAQSRAVREAEEKAEETEEVEEGRQGNRQAEGGPMRTLVSHQRFGRALAAGAQLLRARRCALGVAAAVVLAALACAAPSALAVEFPAAKPLKPGSARMNSACRSWRSPSATKTARRIYRRALIPSR